MYLAQAQAYGARIGGFKAKADVEQLIGQSIDGLKSIRKQNQKGQEQ